MQEKYLLVNKKIKESSNIALISHRFPDWDTLGSATALYEIILTNFEWKNVDIVNFDSVAEKLSFLPNSEKISKNFEIDKYDLLIFLDIGNIVLAWWGEIKDFKWKTIINIDHHFANINYWDINLVDISKPSTTSILYDYFKSMDYKINSRVATSLLTWIYTDTGAFMYSNVTPGTFEDAAELLSKWWDLEAISSNFFLNNTFEFVKLFGLALQRLKISKEGVALSYLKKEDIINSWCKYEELDWIVWRLNMLDNIRYVLFLYEKWDIVKGSLRTTREDIDLNDIARPLNWWWHKKACWLSLEWNIELDKNGHLTIKMINWSIKEFF